MRDFPFYNQALTLLGRYQQPFYGLAAFRSLIRTPTVADYASMMAMQGSSPLLARRLFEQAQRQAMLQGYQAWRQYRLGLDQAVMQLAVQGMGADMDRLGLAYQERWLRTQRRTSLINNLISLGGFAVGGLLSGPLGSALGGFLTSKLGLSRWLPSMQRGLPSQPPIAQVGLTAWRPSIFRYQTFNTKQWLVP